MDKKKLPTWEQLERDNGYSSFDGERYKTELTSNKCTHSQIKAISGSEARCSCGMGFVGSDIARLIQLIKSANTH